MRYRPTWRTTSRVDRLEAVAREALDQGRRIVALVATMGTTDAFGVDDLDGIADLRDRLVKDYNLDYRPHIHADAVIGWAWSVFNDYDFEANPLGFRPRTVRALAAARRRISKLHRADSVGIDFHKTGFTPYISSLFLARDRADMQLLVRGRDQMPYLFQRGERHPGVFTLETSRGGSGGARGLRQPTALRTGGPARPTRPPRGDGGNAPRASRGPRLHDGPQRRRRRHGHRLSGLSRRRGHLDGPGSRADRPRCAGRAAAAQRLHRRLFRYLYERAMRGEGVRISMTDCYRETDYGEPMVGLKSFILSPFIDERDVEQLVRTFSTHGRPWTPLRPSESRISRTRCCLVLMLMGS